MAIDFILYLRKFDAFLYINEIKTEIVEYDNMIIQVIIHLHIVFQIIIHALALIIYRIIAMILFNKWINLISNNIAPKR